MVVSVTNRTAVYGSVRPVVWQGSVGDRRPYADQTRLWSLTSRIPSYLQAGGRRFESCTPTLNNGLT